MNTARSGDQRMQRLIAGRTLDEQIECISKHGNHGTLPVIREMVLQGAGIAKPKKTAKNLIVFGCYMPFTSLPQLCDYIKILDYLGLDYTYLEKEFCCGLPMIETTEGAENSKALEAGKEFMIINRDLGQQKGATTISYFCVWCAYLAKRFFPDDAGHHLYYPDLIIPELEKRTLKVAPTVVGYYEGCHARNRAFAPGLSLDWSKYRELLDRIQGLKVVGLPNSVCCSDHPELIVEEAGKKNLDTILCSCIGCYIKIGAAAMGKVRMKYLTDVLLQALKGA